MLQTCRQKQYGCVMENFESFRYRLGISLRARHSMITLVHPRVEENERYLLCVSEFDILFTINFIHVSWQPSTPSGNILKGATLHDHTCAPTCRRKWKIFIMCFWVWHFIHYIISWQFIRYITKYTYNDNLSCDYIFVFELEIIYFIDFTKNHFEFHSLTKRNNINSL